jgi:hypothetical protein
MYEMTVDYPGETEHGEIIPVGTVVQYLGHVPGGMVLVKILEGIPSPDAIRIMHPHCFKNLRG